MPQTRRPKGGRGGRGGKRGETARAPGGADGGETARNPGGADGGETAQGDGIVLIAGERCAEERMKITPGSLTELRRRDEGLYLYLVSNNEEAERVARAAGLLPPGV